MKKTGLQQSAEARSDAALCFAISRRYAAGIGIITTLTRLELLNDLSLRIGVDIDISLGRAQVSVTGEHLNVSD
jgi:hypothetical protein